MSQDPYLTEIAYPAHFHREMTPAWMVSTLTAAGRATPSLDGPFHILELGCGLGLNTLTAAACHPQAQCSGLDFSSREVAAAQALAERTGLTNARFFCEDLKLSAQQAAQQEAPDCDFIVCHGVYSWVDASTRTAIHQIVQRRLKPGGIVYLAYMSQPGSAIFCAAQKLMWLHSRRQQTDIRSKARSSLKLVQTLARGGAGCFVEHPAAQREIERMQTTDDAYLAHELLNRDWHAHHVADVLEAMQEAGCGFAASATPIENIDGMSLPGGVQPILQNMQAQGASTAEMETAKDIARNQNLRRDLYQKPFPAGSAESTMLASAQHRSALLAQRVALLGNADIASARKYETLNLSTRIGQVTMPSKQILPLLTALQQGSHSYAQLARLPAYAGSPGLINQLLQILNWAGWIQFLAGAPEDRTVRRAAMERLVAALDDGSAELPRSELAYMAAAL